MSTLTVTQTNGGTLTVALQPAPALSPASYGATGTVDPSGQLLFLPSGAAQPVLLSLAGFVAYLQTQLGSLVPSPGGLITIGSRDITIGGTPIAIGGS